jgi:hypothetical protein
MRLAQAIRTTHCSYASLPFTKQPTRQKRQSTNKTKNTHYSQQRRSRLQDSAAMWHKLTSSYAESCSAPNPRGRVEDVHSVAVAAARCARHETRTSDPHNTLLLRRQTPHKATHAATTTISSTTRTPPPSEDRDSKIRQRCGCKRISSYAESCSAPNPRGRVEDVHSVGDHLKGRCARHETRTSDPHNTLLLRRQAPHKATHAATTTISSTTRTSTPDEDRDSKIRQRCGCKP